MHRNIKNYWLVSRDAAFTISFEKEFHSLIVRGKNENLKMSFFALGTKNLKSWLPRVLLSLLGLRSFSAEKPVNLSVSLYMNDSLAVFVLVARISQLRSLSI